jgi:diguanylate cyclase (GGDEF)-like protein
MINVAVDDLSIFASSAPADRRQSRTAQAVVVVAIIVFLAAAPFSRVALPHLWAFIPCYESVLAANNLVAAVLLFAQFHRAASRDLYILACGFLLAGCLAIAHELAFPGVFTATGLFGAGSQTAPWLYMFWHAALPIFVILYAALKDAAGASPRERWRPRFAIAGGVAAALAASALLTFVAAGGRDLLPSIAPANGDIDVMVIVVSCVLGLGLFALAVLYLRRPYFVLDLWMMVVMAAWIFDVALSAVLNAGRFDFGFYVGCAFGLFASSVMIMALPLENGRLYARLADAAEELRRLATTDPLTGLANRRAFEGALELEWRRAARRNIPLSLALIDVDFFKRYNDCYGHAAGDDCLKAVAGALSATARRAGELAARYGGEEFVLLLPHVDADEAQLIVERACKAVADLDIAHQRSDIAPRVTISVGLASMSSEAVRAINDGALAGNEDVAASSLVVTADRALYAAKALGRNRACLSSATEARELRTRNLAVGARIERPLVFLAP